MAGSLDETSSTLPSFDTAYYEDWGMDSDMFLSEEEFTAGFYQTWDTDDDGEILQSEWNPAVADHRVEAANWQAWNLVATTT